MRFALLASFILVVGLALALTSSNAQEAKPKPSAGESGAAAPFVTGKEHQFLADLAGDWDAELHMIDPSGTEQLSKGWLHRVRVGDYHTADRFEGDAMGIKMVGHGVNSFCTVSRKFKTTWIDTMTPSPMVLEGDYDATKRELVMTGLAFGPSGKLEPCRSVTTIHDAHRYTWTFSASMDNGSEVPCLRVEYTRRKP